MERPNIVQTQNGNSAHTHRPMFSSVMETSLRYKSFTQKNNSTRDNSYSSYLLRPEEPNNKKSALPSSSQEDTELSIFDAQKYFNETNDHHHIKENKTRIVSPVSPSPSPPPPPPSPPPPPPVVVNVPDQPTCDRDRDLSSMPRLSSVSSVDQGGYPRNYRARSFHATPTASSEASWNSQTGLLSNPPGSIAVSLRNPPHSTDHDHDRDRKKSGSSGSKWFLLRKCPCSGKKSVQVKDELSPRSLSASTFAVADNISHTNYQNHQKQSLKSTEQTSVAETISQRSTSFTHEFLMQKQEIKDNIPKVQRVSITAQHHNQNQNQNQNNQHRVVVGPGIRPFGDNFSFPILKEQKSSHEVLKLVRLPPPVEDPPRDSLEVFQPPLSDESILSKSINAVASSSQDRRGGTYGFPASPILISRVTSTTEDDVASDASSDLFEIETFSTQTSSYPMYRRRDSLDVDEAPTFNGRRIIATNGGGGGGGGCLYGGRRSVDEPATPSVAPTECYEPSEASIDWSVTTAEGFDRACSVTNYSISATSEFGDITTMRRELVERSGGGLMMIGFGSDGGTTTDGSTKRRSSGTTLLSCRHEKAVSVGPQPVKYCGHGEGDRERWGPPALALALNSTTRHVSSRPPSFNKPPLGVGTSHSARLSLAFAT